MIINYPFEKKKQDDGGFNAGRCSEPADVLNEDKKIVPFKYAGDWRRREASRRGYLLDDGMAAVNMKEFTID